MRRSSVTYLIAGGVLSVFAVVTNSDFKDELREFDHYCDMVEAGHWPDFKNLADECPRGEREHAT